MLSAIGLEKSYYKIIEITVCSRESKGCMIHRCNVSKIFDAIFKTNSGARRGL